MIDFSNACVFNLKKADASKFSSEMNDILIDDEPIIGCYQEWARVPDGRRIQH